MMPDVAAKLRRFQSWIDNDPALRSCVLDSKYYDGVLVVLCGGDRDLSSVKLTLSTHWIGNIEVFRLSDLVVGSKSRIDDILSPNTERFWN